MQSRPQRISLFGIARQAVWLVGALLLAVPADATPLDIPTQLVGIVADDLDDAGRFLYAPHLNAIEIFDISVGVEFGFYYDGDPGNQIQILDALDETDPPGVAQEALISFADGRVYDFDGGVVNSVQSTFTSQPGVPIGFYFRVPAGIFYSDPVLNPSGADVVGTFPSLNNPDEVNFLTFQSGEGTLAISLVKGLQAIPEPGTQTLLAIGLGLLGIVRRRRGTAR